LPFSPPSSDAEQKAFWRSEAPSLFGEAISRLSSEQLKLYDAIIVDEAQDILTDDFLDVLDLLVAGGLG
jgi:superfamily I DNA and RNA helicase